MHCCPAPHQIRVGEGLCDQTELRIEAQPVFLVVDQCDRLGLDQIQGQLHYRRSDPTVATRRPRCRAQHLIATKLVEPIQPLLRLITGYDHKVGTEEPDKPLPIRPLHLPRPGQLLRTVVHRLRRTQ